MSEAKIASQSDKIVQMRASAHVDTLGGIKNFELKKPDEHAPNAESSKF